MSWNVGSGSTPSSDPARPTSRLTAGPDEHGQWVPAHPDVAVHVSAWRRRRTTATVQNRSPSWARSTSFSASRAWEGGAGDRRAPQRVAGEGGDDGGVDPLAADVADRHDPVAGGRSRRRRRSRRRPRRRRRPAGRRRRRRAPGCGAAPAGSGSAAGCGPAAGRAPRTPRPAAWPGAAHARTPAARWRRRSRCGRRPGGLIVALEHGVDEHREPRSPSARTMSSAISRALPCILQHRGVVGLVVDPPAGSEQLGEGPPADQILTLVAGQLRKVWLTLMIVPSGVVDR